jgi:hypothetical protein
VPLPGGPADKLGNRYELWWTVLQVQNILRGQWDSIRVEIPGNDKVEFELVRDTLRSFHQAKRNAPDGKWTLAELGSADAGILQGIAEHLKKADAEYVFVSSSDAHELSELSARARASVSLQEFSGVFTAAKEQQQRLSRLQKYWNNCDLERVRDYLRRIEIRVLDERSMKEQALLGAQTLFLAPPANVCSEVCALLIDSVHKTLTRDDIVQHLEKAGYVRRQVVSIDRAKLLVAGVTKNYLSVTRSRLIQGTLVSREVTKQLFANVGPAGSDCVLTGRAGSGKTGCIAEFVQRLESDEIPVLAFRLDRIDPVASTADLGRKLGLEESPALVLAAAAENHSAAVLVVDQLDAISTTSGRTTSFFDTLETLLNEARGLRARIAIHIVLVCREFDWKNDHRLRKLLATGHNHVAIGDFSKEQVLTVLRTAGYTPESMRARTLDLLCLPQNLSLFLEASVASDLLVSTTLELYEQYWKAKRRLVNERAAPTQDHWQSAIHVLVEGMTDSQQLSIRREMLDQIPSDYIEQMISEGVITLSGNRVGFGHESFFDYCFARQFVISSQSLVEFLLAHEQHLFRRAQVRQVLQYIHEDEPARFCTELEQLVRDPKIRTHLKDLALAVASACTRISEIEWDLWSRLIEPHLNAVRGGTTSDVVSSLAWRHFFGSGSLFEQALQHGIARAWIDSENDSIVDLGVSYLRVHEARFSADVAALLGPFKGNAAWRQKLLWFMQFVELNGSRQMFDLFLALIDDGTLDEARGVIAVNSTFWSLVYGLADKNPERMCEVLAAWLRRKLELARETGTSEHQISFKGEQFADEPISKAARSAPEYYIRCVLPIIVATASWAAYPENDLPRRDRVWPYLMVRDHGQDPHDAALVCLQEALENVSSASPESLQSYLDSLKEEDTYIANTLLMCIFAGGGKHFSSQAVDLFSKQSWRFECGLMNNSHWFAQKAITSVSMNCSGEELTLLESTILQYVAPWEKTPSGFKYYGLARFNLLAGIPVERRSHRVNLAFRELERKFGQPSGEPEGVRGGTVGPPIPQDRLEKMDDEAILAAISHYSANERPRDHSRDFLKGGNPEFARAIGAMAAKEPHRFGQLAMRLPSNASPEYWGEFLRALQKAPVDDSLKLQVVSKAFAEQRDGCGGEVADLLSAIEDPLPQESLEELSWLVLCSPDPSEEAWKKQSSTGKNYYDGDPHFHGINTTRGRAALAIGTLINRDPQYVERFEPTLHRMTEEQSEAVLTCVAFTLRAVAVRNYVYAWELFEKCCIHTPSLQSSKYGVDLVRVGIRAHFDLVRPHIEALLRSPDQRATELGSHLACIAALMHPEAEEMAEAAVTGDEAQRLAVARVAAANLGIEEFRPWCEKQLVHRFSDTDKKVREEAGNCLRHLDGIPLESFASLIDAYCNSPAFEDNSHSLLYTLEGSVEKLPGVVCTACEIFLKRFGPEARDFRTGRAADGYTVSKLIFRVYHQHQRDQWGSRTLDVIDRLCQEGVGEVMTQLQEFDR